MPLRLGLGFIKPVRGAVGVLNAIWPQLCHLQNGTINFDSERQGGRAQELSKLGF